MIQARQQTSFLFDLDGTLVDSVYDHVLAWHDALQEEGIEVSVWRLHRKIGMSGGLFTKALAREHSRHNILCNVVSPGATRTAGYDNVKYSRPDPEKFDGKNEKQIPLRRIGEPAEVARMITFLATDDASYVQGQIISVSGGLTMVG